MYLGSNVAFGDLLHVTCASSWAHPLLCFRHCGKLWADTLRGGPKTESQTKCVLQFATGLRAAAKSDSDSDGLWVARNLALLERLLSLPAQPPADSCSKLRP